MTTASPAVSRGPSALSRVYGLGSIFAKTVRDSRRATIIAAIGLALVFVGVSRAITAEFDTPQSREELENLVNAVPPILQGMAGQVVNVGTLGGYLQYKYGVFFPLVLCAVVDPRAIGDARRRVAARQPRVRRRHRPIATAHRAREAVGSPPDDGPGRAGGLRGDCLRRQRVRSAGGRRDQRPLRLRLRRLVGADRVGRRGAGVRARRRSWDAGRRPGSPVP